MAISAAKIMLDLVLTKVREDVGPNIDSRGIIAQMNQKVGAAKNAPYCASTVSHAFRKASAFISNTKGLIAFPYTASSQAIKRFFRDKGKGWYSENPQDILEWDGAVAGWTNEGDPWHGHVFMILRRFTSKGANGKLTLVAVETAEGNTSPAGSREGSGIYILRRQLFPDGLFYPVDAKKNKVGPGRKLWFCNTTKVIGGSSW